MLEVNEIQNAETTRENFQEGGLVALMTLGKPKKTRHYLKTEIKRTLINLETPKFSYIDHN